MSEQPKKKLMFGTPEYKTFMAKRKAERAATAAKNPSTAYSPSTTGSNAGIAASIFAQVTAFKSAPAPMPTPAPDPTIRSTDGSEVQDGDWTPKSPELHGWSDDNIARVNDLGSKSPLAATATFGIHRSDQPASGFPSKDIGPDYRANRISPSIDSTYRSNNGEEHPRLSWGCASKPSGKIIQRHKDRAPANATPRKFHGATIQVSPLNEPPKVTAQHDVYAASLKPTQSHVPTPQRELEQSVQRSSGQQVTQSRFPRPTDSPPISPVHHDPTHMRYTNTYSFLDRKELRNELMLRGLEIPKSDKLADYIDVLTANDQEWSNQLLALEHEVLSELLDKDKVNDFMRDKPLHARRYLEYGQLAGVLIDHYLQTPDDDILLKLRPEEQHKILLRIANRDGVVMLIPNDHGDIARKIADFRAQKVAAEGTDRPQRQRIHSHERPIRPIRPIVRPHRHNLNATPPKLTGTKRQRDNNLDDEFEDEAKPLHKKARRDGTLLPIKIASTTIKTGHSAGPTTGQSTPQIKKHQRATNDEEEPELEHKKARRVTAPIKKAFKKEEAPEATTKQSDSSTKEVKRAKRQRDDDDNEETKPAKKKSRRQRQESSAHNKKEDAAGPSTRKRNTRNSRKASGTDGEEPKPKYVVIEWDDDEFADFIDDDSEDESDGAKKRRDDEEKFSRARFRRAAKLVKD